MCQHYLPMSTLRKVAWLAAAALWPVTASAALGGTVASVEADRVHAKGSLTRIVRTDAYALHEIRSAVGTTIREYVSPAGTVFPLPWDRPWMPHMTQGVRAPFDPHQQVIAGRPPETRPP